MRPRTLAGSTSAESVAPARPTVVVPLGSTEQHGRHLPLDTDTVIAVAVAERLVDLIRREHPVWDEDARDAAVLLAPAVAYGASGEHQGFPGTVSIGTEALVQLLVELVRSLSTWAGRTVLLNGHGGNLTALRRAVETLRHEGHDVCWAPCATPTADAHAGRTETSVMLHLRPEAVRLERAEVGCTTPVRDLLGRLETGGVGSVSPNGVLGDPTGAHAGEGRALLEEMASLAHARVRAVPAGGARG